VDNEVSLIAGPSSGSKTGTEGRRLDNTMTSTAAASVPANARPGTVRGHTDGMETRNIGKLDASVIGLGCNNFGGRIDEAATKQVVNAALDAGITLFRHGRHLRRDPQRGVSRPRARFAARRSRHRDQVRRSDRRGTQGWRQRGVHRPGGRGQPAPPRHRPHPTYTSCTFLTRPTPFEETLEALDTLVRAGKVVEIGASNLSEPNRSTKPAASAPTVDSPVS